MAVSITGLGQEKPLTFRIVSFGENQFDMSAANPEYQKLDGDGMPYAIIKVKSETPGDDVMQYDFNFFNMKHEKKNVNGELWVYVQRNAKNVTITRPGYIPVSQYALNHTIESGRNYEMVIRAESKEKYKQQVRFDVTPANSAAHIVVTLQNDGAKEEYFGDIGEDGSVSKNLECGKYRYKVVAKDFVTVDGRLDLSYMGPDSIGPTVIEKVTLVSKLTEAKKLQDKENRKKDSAIMAKQQISTGSKREYFRNTEFYVAPGVRIGSGMGIGIAAGARIHNINLEVGYSLGVTKGNEVMWAQTEPTESYVGKCAYSVDALEFKAGYQIGLGEKAALTPQIGYLGQKLSGGDWGNGAMCHNLSIGANLTYKFAPAVGVFVNPAYAVPVMVNDLYTAINEKGGPTKGGFQTRVGLEISFGK